MDSTYYLRVSTYAYSRTYRGPMPIAIYVSTVFSTSGSLSPHTCPGHTAQQDRPTPTCMPPAAYHVSVYGSVYGTLLN